SAPRPPPHPPPLPDALPICASRNAPASPTGTSTAAPPVTSRVAGISHATTGSPYPRASATAIPYDSRVEGSAKIEASAYRRRSRSEEHTSELQSRVDLVCRL